MNSKGHKGSGALRAFGVFVSLALAYGTAHIWDPVSGVRSKAKSLEETSKLFP